jgi:Ca-activated chloride channel family protein
MELSTLHAFHFLRPAWLAALPPLWALAWWLARRGLREGDWARLIDADLLPDLRLGAGQAASGGSPWPWLALAWTVAALALAGPSWQKDITAAYRGSAAWVLVLDLSPSMAATDLAPNRVTRARYAIDDLLGAAHDARVGLVAFSDEAYTVSPLTDDVATVRALLPPLAPDIMPSPGDHLAPALQQAGQLLQGAGSRDARVLLLSDGFDDPAAAFGAAQRLRGSGVHVDVIGVGTRDGAPMSGAGGSFASDAQGRTAMTRLDADRLRELAAAGGGEYVELSGLPGLLARLQAKPESAGGSAAAQDVEVAHWRDAGAWLLPGILLLAAALARRGWL